MRMYYASRVGGYTENPEHWARVSLLLSYSDVIKFQDHKKAFEAIVNKPRSKTEDEIGCSSLFLDSGAFAMRRLSWDHQKKTGRPWQEFYDSPDFWQYMDDYIKFVKENQDGLDLYANIDVIPDPILSRRNQNLLEAAGLNPVPVVHLGTSMDWLRHYIECGYDPIGLGGLVAKGGFGTNKAARNWLDECFDIVCDTPDRLPIVRMHGFGLAGPLAFKYPFWSTDSTRWVMPGSFGSILVPQERGGELKFNVNPLQVYVSNEKFTMIKTSKGLHYLNLSRKERKVCDRWLELIGIPYGNGPKEDPDPAGVSNSRALRIKATLLYYEHLRMAVPEYPWPFRRKRKRSRLGVI